MRKLGLAKSYIFNSSRKAGLFPRNLTVAGVVLLAGISLTDTRAQTNNNRDKNDDGEQSETGETVLDNGTLIPLPDTANEMRNGNSNQSCTILVTEPGTLGSSIENLEMNSKLLGGRPGGAQVSTTNASYTLSVDPPLGFSTSPPNGSSNVNMTASFLGTGVTNFSETPGNISIRLRRGLTVVKTHLSATRTDSNPFPAGFYSATVTLRCE
ncbi:MAG: hypothetical protein ACR2O3_01695 [Rhizobiaceae bacterium]